MDSTAVLVHDDRPDRLGQSAESTNDQSQCDVPEQAGRAIRPRLLPRQAYAAAQGPFATEPFGLVFAPGQPPNAGDCAASVWRRYLASLKHNVAFDKSMADNLHF